MGKLMGRIRLWLKNYKTCIRNKEPIQTMGSLLKNYLRVIKDHVQIQSISLIYGVHALRVHHR
jgi:hypothetical protein